MTRDDIIRMAREAGASFETAESMFRFAALVAAAEREACAQPHPAAAAEEMSRSLIVGSIESPTQVSSFTRPGSAQLAHHARQPDHSPGSDALIARSNPGTPG